MSVTINGTTGIAGVDGSASTPAFQGTDTNTGIAFPAADTVTVATGGTERMRVDSSGNVGIGTSSPATKLNVNGTILVGVDGTSASGDQVIRANDSLAGYTNDNGGNLVLKSGRGTGTVGSYMSFYTSTTGASGSSLNALAERMRIDSSGRLLVGGTSSYGGERVTVDFSGSGQRGMVVRNTTTTTQDSIGFVVNSSFVGWISASTTATTYNTASDYRLKENVQPMTGALNKVAALKPVTYTWKSNGSVGQGFIAHELQAVVPDCVTGKKDEVDANGNPKYQGVDTSFLVATLTAAIQELSAKLDEANARIAALEAK